MWCFESERKPEHFLCNPSFYAYDERIGDAPFSCMPSDAYNANYYGIIKQNGGVFDIMFVVIVVVAYSIQAKPKVCVPIDGTECDWNVSFLFTLCTHTISALKSASQSTHEIK